MKKMSLILLAFASFSFADESKIVEIGNDASLKLLKALKGELVKALSKSPYEAIKVCNEKALKITKRVEQSLGNGIKIKRTSLKYRNPKNKPDKFEEIALKTLMEKFKQGENPKYFIQELDNEYRFYKPLKIKTVCLTCHSSKANMDKNLLKEIKKYYPEDLATGYKEGDFRGVIRVSIPKHLAK